MDCAPPKKPAVTSRTNPNVRHAAPRYWKSIETLSIILNTRTVRMIAKKIGAPCLALPMLAHLVTACGLLPKRNVPFREQECPESDTRAQNPQKKRCIFNCLEGAEVGPPYAPVCAESRLHEYS